MFIIAPIIKKQKLRKQLYGELQSLLKQHHNDDNSDVRVIERDKQFIRLGPEETPPENTTLYKLSEDDYQAILATNNCSRFTQILEPAFQDEMLALTKEAKRGIEKMLLAVRERLSQPKSTVQFPDKLKDRHPGELTAEEYQAKADEIISQANAAYSDQFSRSKEPEAGAKEADKELLKGINALELALKENQINLTSVTKTNPILGDFKPALKHISDLINAKSSSKPPEVVLLSLALVNTLGAAELGLVTSGAKAAGQKLSATAMHSAAPAFSVASTLLSPLICGVQTYAVYKFMAKKKFESKFKRPPTDAEVKEIEATAKNVAINSATALGFGDIMRAYIVPLILKATALHPAGIAGHAAAAVLVGLFSGIGAAMAHVTFKTTQCKTNAEQKALLKSPEFWKSVTSEFAFGVFSGVTAYLAGFIPEPAKKWGMDMLSVVAKSTAILFATVLVGIGLKALFTPKKKPSATQEATKTPVPEKTQPTESTQESDTARAQHYRQQQGVDESIDFFEDIEADIAELNAAEMDQYIEEANQAELSQTYGDDATDASSHHAEFNKMLKREITRPEIHSVEQTVITNEEAAEACRPRSHTI